MVHTDKESLLKIINKNKQYIKKLETLRQYKEQEFLNDWKVYSLTDRYLHLALESMLDIGKKVINQLDMEKPDYYSDIPRILADNKIIPRDRQSKYEELAKFRNTLVHDYLYLDHKEIYRHLQEDLGYLKEFVQFVIDYLKSQKEKN